ncbi:MAG TPA: amylo-alpha-1,6-glucosidase [Chitinophagaceae bacterium]|nr:amylo-alpha-1,6-glucosidase [Chitinophagaceae bacterium]
MITLAKNEILASLPFNNGEDAAEWLETNGLGGWSSSTISGCNTRRYHGLLVAAITPPAERMSLVSKLEETLITGESRFELGTNNYGNAIHPEGYNYLTLFTKDIFPCWMFEAGGIQLKKTIGMAYGENTTAILYEVIKASHPFTLQLLPLFSVRGYHNLAHANNTILTRYEFNNTILKVKLYDGTPEIFIKVPGADFNPQPYWFYNFNYSIEQARGLDYTEDLFSHGHFMIKLKDGDTLGIVISTGDNSGKEAQAILQAEQQRRKGLFTTQGVPPLQRMLILAADQFIVQRGDNLKTVIAGYHWFTDWGRDTMISLPGLCLSTARYADAKKIIIAFAGSVSKGMLPNRFQDGGQPPEYNNVDGTLWYFIAVYKYLQVTGDKDFILNEILPVLKDIIDWHYKGTRYNIHTDADGLLYAGEKGIQLTWMDARVNNQVVTPRMGKPVEIQALWYNALKIFAVLLALNNQQNDAEVMNTNAAKAKHNFSEKFWYDGGYLYDVIDENGNADASLRPNQLFAVSLPFPLVEKEKAAAILRAVTETLYTPAGLRSLSPTDPRYIGSYTGNQYQRDSAYHQGTVWAWLIGPYIDAVIRVSDDRGKAATVIETFARHLKQFYITTIPEIFDGDAPHRPKGCIAQAWSVAELLRVMKEYNITV